VGRRSSGGACRVVCFTRKVFSAVRGDMRKSGRVPQLSMRGDAQVVCGLAKPVRVYKLQREPVAVRRTFYQLPRVRRPHCYPPSPAKQFSAMTDPPARLCALAAARLLVLACRVKNTMRQ